MFIAHPTINMKCVVFAALVIGLYFHRPSPCVTESKTTAGLAAYLIFFVAYTAMALYDEYHWNRGCKHASSVLLKSGSGPTSLLKPPPRSQHQLSSRESRASGVIIWVSHIAFLAPLVAYIGIYGAPSWRRATNSRALNVMLIFLAVMTWLYHGGRLARHINSPSEYARGGITALTPDVASLMSWDAVIDVRSLSEWNAGHHPRAMHVPNHDDLTSLSIPKDSKILVYCKIGRRARTAAESMRQAGYSGTFHLVGTWSDLQI